MLPSWYDYFKERADACGLPVPDSPYKTAATTLALIKAFTDCLKDLGPDAIKKMSLGAFLTAMRNRAAYDAAVKAQIEAFAKAGFSGARARFVLGSQVGTASGVVSTSLGILASAYIGGLIGCAIYATDKCLGGALDDSITSASVAFWEWVYGVEAKRRENEQMQAKLQVMRALRGVASDLGMRPSELADMVAKGQRPNFY